jgi:hypothetical protein
VLPGPWPYTELETKDPKVKWEIKAQRVTSDSKPERSYRAYSCDEFPAASWIEGGVGMPNGRLTLMKAIPYSSSRYQQMFPKEMARLEQLIVLQSEVSVVGKRARVSRSQASKIGPLYQFTPFPPLMVADIAVLFRQGSSHGALKARLAKQVEAQTKAEYEAQGKKAPKFSFRKGASVQFHLRLINDPTSNVARIYYRDYDTGQDTHSTVIRRSIEHDIPHNLSRSSDIIYGEIQLTDRIFPSNSLL